MNAIVIGAGISGLAAARELSRVGIDTLVLEAGKRIGGRIHTIFDERVSAPIELGAEFIHGNPPEILELARAAGLKVVETGGNSWKLNDREMLQPAGFEPPGSNNGLWATALAYVKNGKADVSFETFLKLPETADISALEKEWSRRYVGGFHAAELDKVGLYSLVRTQTAEEEINGDVAHRMPTGYLHLAKFLHRESQSMGSKYLLEHTVKLIDWTKPLVRIETLTSAGDSARFEVDAVVLTVPANILKTSPDSKAYIKFNPEITAKRTALEKIEMGSARRIILAFKDKWWIDILEKLDKGRSQLGFLFAQEVPISVWWTNEPSEAAILVGWVGGQRSLEMSGFNTDQITDVAISSLDRIFKIGESFIERQLIASHSYDWQHDPLSLGAYTYLGVNGSDAPARLSESLEDRLYFAGEATSFEGHWGTVHGAFGSGVRAAREVISSF